MGRRSTATLFAAAAISLACAGSATAARSLTTGFSEFTYQSADSATRAAAFERTLAANAEIVRVNLVWSRIARSQPADPRNPADPAYDFSGPDRAIAEARANGLDVLVTIYSAPEFAEGASRHPDAPPGTWKPDPAALGDFSAAVASRYSGGFRDLPRVRHFEVWNEPNLGFFLAPQYKGKTAVAPRQYRRMVNEVFKAVKGVNAGNKVVAGGLAPYGDPPGASRTRPLAFWRDLLCLDRDLDASKCPTKTKFDILSHHPINTSGGPRKSARHPDDVSTRDFENITEVLRAAEKRNTVGTGGRHPLWATELWWDSDPPDTVEGFPLKAQARFIQEALYILWKQHVDVVVLLQLRDEPFDPEGDPFSDSSTGLLFDDGSPKPSFTSFRFPLVTDELGRKTRVWGKSPESGKLAIQLKRGNGWRTVKKLGVDRGDTFSTQLQLPRSYRIRAEVSGATSLTWRSR